MSILQVPATLPYPPGITGDPYTPDDISKFYDLNWPPIWTGVLSTGFTKPGLMGLGQDDSGDDDSGVFITDSGSPLNTSTPVTTPIDTTITNSQQACGTGWSLALNSAGDAICQQNGTTTTAPVPVGTALTPAQAGLTAAQQAQLIAATGNSAVSLIRTAAGGPYQVAGTNLIYNPATGALTTSTAVNATAALTAGLSSLTPYLPMILLAVAAVVVIPMLGKK
jgi:hypothetical protein